jgi:uncharacterized membrane protein YidH (DUF202 family)
MVQEKYHRLVKRGILSAERLEELIAESVMKDRPIEESLSASGVPRHELLFCLSEYYGIPFVEYDESIIVSQQIVRRMDMERLKHALWLPLSITEEKAEVIACYPRDPSVLADIRATLGVERVMFKAALPSDLVRIIEHNQDLNPGFPSVAGRTPLAKVRTFLAERRSRLSCYRTTLAKGRTGLAFLRTGVSFITIAMVLIRVFGNGYLTVVEALLFASGLVMIVDGLRWYLPSRRAAKNPLHCPTADPTGGTSVLTVSDPGASPVFIRSDEVAGADEVRRSWSSLSPVMRRRFLASDRTDLAEERTQLACYRTLMARARTGLSFTRTGIAFAGLGVALLRQFHDGLWVIVDWGLISIGVAKVLEGFSWYLPGRRAGEDGSSAVNSAGDKPAIWEAVFPPFFRRQDLDPVMVPVPPVKGFASPGIWGTTGLALERTLLAERRNVMARLRTVMARSRTGMAFIRTGMSIAAVGLGLLAFFGAGSVPWTLFDAFLIMAGLLFIVDGLYWYVPAERTRKEFPYCYGEMEITVPDYGVPARSWRKAVFSDDVVEN